MDGSSKLNLVCPCCKSALTSNACAGCGTSYQVTGGIRNLFSESTVSQRYREIGVFYDRLYQQHDAVWENVAARGREFNEFVASLVSKQAPGRYLDVGCGQGHLLASVKTREKHGIEISAKAAQNAMERSGATVCLGISEELPYPNASFSTVTSIGVITHLIDDVAATKEIHRVLCAGGCYLVGVYLKPSKMEQVLTKIMEFSRPYPKPVQFVKWVVRRYSQKRSETPRSRASVHSPQPVERFYTIPELEHVFATAGFRIENLITKKKFPDAPLSGSHFRLYVLRKDGK